MKNKEIIVNDKIYNFLLDTGHLQARSNDTRAVDTISLRESKRGSVPERRLQYSPTTNLNLPESIESVYELCLTRPVYLDQDSRAQVREVNIL